MVSTLFHLVEGMPGKPLVARFGPIRLPCLTMSLFLSILSNFHTASLSYNEALNFVIDFVPPCRGGPREATGSSVRSDTASLSYNEALNFVKFSWSRLCSIL